MSFATATSLHITSVSDASCNSSVPSNEVHVIVNGPPQITSQPQSQSIKIGDTATLHVSATGVNVLFFWYEGNLGDTSRPVGDGTADFTTPHLHETTKYWVKTATNCGVTNSDQVTITVTIPGRRHPSNH